MSAPSGDILVLKHLLKTVHILNGSNGLNMADLCDRKVEEDKIDSMLWSKLFKILIGDENMEAFMEDATLKVSIFLQIHGDGSTAG